ncbi:MAG: hypothetical protein JSS81_29225 [Acidobacteria bacterium]|nr:hypothetical protein [Acidobacteriota bacterium]
MSATIDIIIKGISIIYRKGDLWKVIFPIETDQSPEREKCHKLFFSALKEDETLVCKESLAELRNVEIKADGVESQTGESLYFRNLAFNLTADANYSHGETHGHVKLKKHPIKFVVMTIPNAYLTVNTFLEDDAKNHQIPDLVNIETNDKKPVWSLIHSFRAIILPGDNGTVTVPNGTPTPFTTEKKVSYQLTFDNDCEKSIPGQNDMDMFYDVIEEFHPVPGIYPPKKFRIGDVGKLHSEKTPPDFAEGLTCLGGKITDQDSIDAIESQLLEPLPRP